MPAILDVDSSENVEHAASKSNAHVGRHVGPVAYPDIVRRLPCDAVERERLGHVAGPDRRPNFGVTLSMSKTL